METTEAKKTVLIQAWEDWDEADESKTTADSPKLCKIENPDCEACQ
jgi:hypothetical protein